MRFAHCEPVNFNGSIRMIHISNLNKRMSGMFFDFFKRGKLVS